MGNVVDVQDELFLKQMGVQLRRAAEQRASELDEIKKFSFSAPIVTVIEQLAGELYNRMINQKDVLNFIGIRHAWIYNVTNDREHKLKYCKIQLCDLSAIPNTGVNTQGEIRGHEMFSMSLHYGYPTCWEGINALDGALILEKATKLFEPFADDFNCGCGTLLAYLESLVNVFQTEGYVFYAYWDNNDTTDIYNGRITFYAVRSDVTIAMTVHGERYLKHLTILNTPKPDTEVQTT